MNVFKKSLAHHKEMYKVPEFLWPGKSTKLGIQYVIGMHAYRFEWVIANISMSPSKLYLYRRKKPIEVRLTHFAYPE